ncbi:putative glycolipid-binding domain-containing protein [Halovulum sp. GXIMD14793]
MSDVRWQDWQGQGLEHCVCRSSNSGLTLEGVVAGTRHGHYGGRYFVRTDDAFRTREVKVSYLDGPDLHLEVDTSGHWRDAIRDTALPDLDGCFDVDIGMTPATNTLPIKRLKLALGESHDIAVAYVPLPDQINGHFLPQRAEQRYTCLQPGRLYRYDGLFRKFTAELEIDEAGLVIDYPETFRRVG